jgi:hypothetical protein
VGYAIAWVGVGSVYIIVAGLCVGALFNTALLTLSGKINDSRDSLWVDLRDGVRDARVWPPIPSPVAFALVRVIFGWSHRGPIPAHAKDVLQLHVRSLGVLARSFVIHPKDKSCACVNHCR